MKRLSLCVLLTFSLFVGRSQNCPSSITVIGPTAAVEAGKVFQLNVDIRGLSASVSVTCNWSVSSGTIVSGQGTPSIMVDGGQGAGSCTATVDIGGLPQTCSTTASTTVEIKPAPEKILTINTITTKAIQDSVKSFIKKTEFENTAIAQDALLNIYAVDEKEFNKIKTMLDKSFESHMILSYQYNIVNAGIKKTASVEMFRIKRSF